MDHPCACGCGRPITDNSRHPWFVSELCQQTWTYQQRQPPPPARRSRPSPRWINLGQCHTATWQPPTRPPLTGQVFYTPLTPAATTPPEPARGHLVDAVLLWVQALSAIFGPVVQQWRRTSRYDPH